MKVTCRGQRKEQSCSARKIVTVRIIAAMAVFVPVVIGTYLLIGRIERKERERMQQELKR